jgi:hypothetical protein
MQKMRNIPKLCSSILIIFFIGVIIYGYRKSQEKEFPVIVSGDITIDVNKINIEEAKRKRDANSLLELYYYYKLVEMDDKVADFWYKKFIEKSQESQGECVVPPRNLDSR